MTIVAVWEIFEFAMDQIAGFDMQKDTVVQWISSVIAYMYLKNQERVQWIGKLVMRRKKKEEDYLRQ